jgi:hypothetical protein
MAKSNSVLKLQGTLSDLTFVNSPTYGNHVRAKRGTHKVAEVNEAFKHESKQLVSANLPAKIIKDAIEPYRRDFIDGQLWQRLVSKFRKQLKDYGKFDFGGMSGFEIHSRYTFERFVRPDAEITIKKKSILQVDIHFRHPPIFTSYEYIDGYQCILIGVFPDLKKRKSTSLSVSSPVIPLTEKVTPLTMRLKLPKGARDFVVLLKIEGTERGVSNNAYSTKGFCAIGGGRI